MNTRKFLSAVWPQSGPYCIATPWVNQAGDTVMAHRGCDTLDDVIAYVLTKKQSKDLYFAPHALKVAREENPETGKFRTSRKHENMREARAFFFDMDVGPDAKGVVHYATLDDVFSALEKFLFETCLPSPFIVCSGYGIHVYFIIDTPIESLAWCEPAARLYWLSQQYEMWVDPSRTTDQSSVLRVPGTFNLKDLGNPRKVEILAEGVVTSTDEFIAQLDDLTAGYTPDTRRTNGKAAGSEPFSVAWDGRRPPADEVAGVCEHMRTFRDSQGNIPEPQWHVGIGTIKHCDDGEAKVHEWSSGYPTYTQAETQTKLDNWTTPPPGCEKISRNSGDPSICARCPYKDVAKNPLLIANTVYEKTHQPASGPAPTSGPDPTPPCQPPAPYTLHMGGEATGVIGVTEKKKGMICWWPMFPVWWVSATANEDCFSIWYAKTPRYGWRKIEIPNSGLEAKNIGGVLRSNDVVVENKQIKNVQAFMLAYLRELLRYQDTLKQYDYVGWEVATQESTAAPVVLGNPKWFVLYERKISVADGSVVPCIMTKQTQVEWMGRAGTLNKQIALMDFFNAPAYMAQQFAIAASLACPFFRFSNLHGMMVCLTGDTGASKSTGAYFAASIWGHPELYCISGLETNATYKGRQERSHIMRNLPFIIDEITRFEDAVAAEMAFAATQPGSYDSLKANREFRKSRGGYKSNVTICTSNKSLTQMVNATSFGGQAGIMRVFEIKVNQSGVHSKAEADEIMHQLLENYGWIGEDFLRRCLPHIDAIRSKFIEIRNQFEATINASQEERYMTACAAIVLLGIKLGNKLGYFPFSYKAMWDWLVNVQIPAMRAVAKSERVRWASDTILSEYLEEINQFMCRVNRNNRGEVEIIHAPPNVEFKARYEIWKNEIYVRTGPFQDYCSKRHHDYTKILNDLFAKGVVTHKQTRRRMRAEPNTHDNPVYCFVVPVKGASPVVVPNAPKVIKIEEFKKKR